MTTLKICGGLFLLYKATTELHERLEGANHYAVTDNHKVHAPFWGVVMQILVLDAVFSIDAVITAVAMVQHSPELSARITKSALWASLILVLAALTIDWWAPLLY